MSKTEEHTIPEAQPTDEIVLSLTQQQMNAALLWDLKSEDQIATAIGITPEVLTQWTKQPIFLAEIAAIRLEMESEVSTEAKQAAALVFSNVPYAQTEAIVGLKEGTLMEWAQKNEFNPCDDLVAEMKEGVPNIFNEPPELEEVEEDPILAFLNGDQVRAISLIIEGKTDAQVGELLGKRRETINRWRNQDELFIKALKAARAAYLDTQIMALSASTPKVITVLQELLDSEDEKIRMQAATHLLKATALSERMKYRF